MKRLLIVCVALALLLSACQAAPEALDAPQPPPKPPQMQTPPPPLPLEPSPPTQHAHPTLDVALETFGINEVERHDFLHGPLAGAELLEEWVENYRQGIPASVGILQYHWQDARGESDPVGLNVLVSDGSAVFALYSFGLRDRMALWGPYRTEFSLLIRRAYDYVLLSDARAEDTPTIIHRALISDRYTFEMLPHNPATDPPLEGITYAQAIERAREVNENHMRYMSVVGTGWLGGWFFRESVLDALDPDALYERHGDISALHYKVVGAVNMGGSIYYLVYASHNAEVLSRLAELHHQYLGAAGSTGSTYSDVWVAGLREISDSGEFDEDRFWAIEMTRMLVGIDGRLVFRLTENGQPGTVFLDDALQEVIAS